ncbi:MAG: nicotinate-nucleotide--dimethylbenzimidazole phosphoribosyltransferase [Rikenellaceae bacterium]
MKNFKIIRPNEEILVELNDKVDNLTKPKGSLGLLEYLAIQIGLVQQTLSPNLKNPHHIVFAADHGVVVENVSLSPKEVTRQMVANFQNGGAGVNFLARQHSIALQIVDAGVDYDFGDEYENLIDMKIRKSTSNYLYKAAMSTEEADLAIERGAQCCKNCFDKGCNIISFGEMGITNTSSSSLWMSLLTGIDLKECVGAGSDHSGEIIAHKYDVLSRAEANYSGDGSAFDVMRYFGGFEMVMTVGSMLEAARLGMVVVVDGFIMTACALVASKLDDNFLNYAIFGHQGDEVGHKLLLEYLKAKPILHLSLRLGEGTGALCAYPIIESSVRMINEMGSFKTVEVVKYF